MLKSILKDKSVSILDLKVRSLINSFILGCDTLDYFERTFFIEMDKVKGMGDGFKELYYTTQHNFKVQVWRRNITGAKDRLLMEIISITY